MLLSIYTMAYYSAIKKIPSFTTAQVELEGLMLSEINQTVKDKYYMISLTCGISKIQTNRGKD